MFAAGAKQGFGGRGDAGHGLRNQSRIALPFFPVEQHTVLNFQAHFVRLIAGEMRLFDMYTINPCKYIRREPR